MSLKGVCSLESKHAGTVLCSCGYDIETDGPEPTFREPLSREELTVRWKKWTESQRDVYRSERDYALRLCGDPLKAANYAAYRVEIDGLGRA